MGKDDAIKEPKAQKRIWGLAFRDLLVHSSELPAKIGAENQVALTSGSWQPTACIGVAVCGGRALGNEWDEQHALARWLPRREGKSRADKARAGVSGRCGVQESGLTSRIVPSTDVCESRCFA